LSAAAAAACAVEAIRAAAETLPRKANVRARVGVGI
jgi:hypothetical protein